MSLKYTCPGCGSPLGYKGLCGNCKCAGMTAAYYLAKQGHDVTLKEAYPTLGGQMAYGIPSYRLPRAIVAKEAG